MMRPPLKCSLFAHIARPLSTIMSSFFPSNIMFSSESKVINETLTMHNVAVAQAVGNLTQRSVEEVDHMHKK